jgi:DNA-binding NarL/FixJ family response regulator
MGHPDIAKLGQALSKSEIRMLIAVARGHTSKTAAEEFHISEQGVKNHVQSAIVKLGANSRTHAVYLYIKSLVNFEIK